MLQSAEFADMPISGTYPEQIFMATQSSDVWSWVRFEDEDFNISYGQFQGEAKAIAISSLSDYCYVLTSNYLYEFQRNDPSVFTVQDLWDNDYLIKNITFSPQGQLIFSDYFDIFTIEHANKSLPTDLKAISIEIENNIEQGYLQFNQWEGFLLSIQVEPPYGTDYFIEIILDSRTMTLTKKTK